MTDTRKPASVIAAGREVMRRHPELHMVSEVLLELDTMEEDDRLKARAYLLHVYGVAVGCVPSERRLEELDTWAQDRNALAAASGHLLALARWVTDSWREHDSEEDEGMVALTEAHAAALLEVAHRG